MVRSTSMSIALSLSDGVPGAGGSAQSAGGDGEDHPLLFPETADIAGDGEEGGANGAGRGVAAGDGAQGDEVDVQHPPSAQRISPRETEPEPGHGEEGRRRTGTQP